MPIFRVMTVCTGNVCRSPMGEVMLRKAVADQGLSDQVEVGSCGLSWESEGEPIDPRTADALVNLGYEVPNHVARTLHINELLGWDLVLTMTSSHLESVKRKVEALADKGPVPEVMMWKYFDPSAPVNARDEDLDVPDPWFSGSKAFDRTAKSMARAVPSIMFYISHQLTLRKLHPERF